MTQARASKMPPVIPGFGWEHTILKVLSTPEGEEQQVKGVEKKVKALSATHSGLL